MGFGDPWGVRFGRAGVGRSLGTGRVQWRRRRGSTRARHLGLVAFPAGDEFAHHARSDPVGGL